MHLLDLLLEEAEGAAGTGAPFVVCGQTKAAGFKNVDHAGLVDPLFAERHDHVKVGVMLLHARTVFFVRSDCDITVDFVACVEPWLDPLSEGLELHDARAPARLRRRQKVIEGAKPVIEVTAGVEVLDGLPEEALEVSKEVIDLGKLA